MGLVRGAFGLIAAGAAGLMIWSWTTGGDCPGGREFASMEACDQAGERPGDCREWLAQANRALSRRGPFYTTQDECVAAHQTCQRADIPMGWTPRARGFCVIGLVDPTIVPRIPGRSG